MLSAGVYRSLRPPASLPRDNATHAHMLPIRPEELSPLNCKHSRWFELPPLLNECSLVVLFRRFLSGGSSMAAPLTRPPPISSFFFSYCPSNYSHLRAFLCTAWHRRISLQLATEGTMYPAAWSFPTRSCLDFGFSGFLFVFMAIFRFTHAVTRIVGRLLDDATWIRSRDLNYKLVRAIQFWPLCRCNFSEIVYILTT